MGETTVGHVAGEVVRALYGAGYMESTIGQYRKSIRCISSSRCFVFSHVFFSGLGSCMHFPYFSGCAEVFLPNMRASLTRRTGAGG